MKTPMKYSKSGLTLVELIVSVALVTLVLSVAFASLLFGFRTFNGGSAQSAIQADLRLASDVIRDETRYASDLAIMNNLVTGSLDPDKNYIYLSSDGKALMQVSGGGSPKTIIDYTGTGFNLQISFEKDAYAGNAISYSETIAGDEMTESILKYTLQAQSTSQNKSYRVDSNVILMNLRSRLSNLDFFDGPIADPPEGDVPVGTVVTLTSTPGSLIYYTLDGSDPTIETGIAYADTGPITITMTTTLKAIATKDDNNVSSRTAAYLYTITSVVDPVIQPPIASGLSIEAKNNPKAGDTVLAKYTYSQPDMVPQGASVVLWYSMKPDGTDVKEEKTETHTPGSEQNFKLTLTNSMKGRSVYFTVTPIAQLDPSSDPVAGNTEPSSPINVHKN